MSHAEKEEEESKQMIVETELETNMRLTIEKFEAFHEEAFEKKMGLFWKIWAEEFENKKKINDF